MSSAEAVQFQADLLSMQLELVDVSATEAQLQYASGLLTPQLFDDVVEDRSIACICGYPSCTKSVGDQLPRRPLVANGTTVEASTVERRLFCSDWCFKAARFFRGQLSQLQPIMRRKSRKQYEAELLSRSPERAAAATAISVSDSADRVSGAAAESAQSARTAVAMASLTILERDALPTPTAPTPSDCAPVPVLPAVTRAPASSSKHGDPPARRAHATPARRQSPPQALASGPPAPLPDDLLDLGAEKRRLQAVRARKKGAHGGEAARPGVRGAAERDAGAHVAATAARAPAAVRLPADPAAVVPFAGRAPPARTASPPPAADEDDEGDGRLEATAFVPPEPPVSRRAAPAIAPASSSVLSSAAAATAVSSGAARLLEPASRAPAAPPPPSAPAPPVRPLVADGSDDDDEDDDDEFGGGAALAAFKRGLRSDGVRARGAAAPVPAPAAPPPPPRASSATAPRSAPRGILKKRGGGPAAGHRHRVRWGADAEAPPHARALKGGPGADALADIFAAKARPPPPPLQEVGPLLVSSPAADRGDAAPALPSESTPRVPRAEASLVAPDSACSGPEGAESVSAPARRAAALPAPSPQWMTGEASDDEDGGGGEDADSWGGTTDDDDDDDGGGLWFNGAVDLRGGPADGPSAAGPAAEGAPTMSALVDCIRGGVAPGGGPADAGEAESSAYSPAQVLGIGRIEAVVPAGEEVAPLGAELGEPAGGATVSQPTTAPAAAAAGVPGAALVDGSLLQPGGDAPAVSAPLGHLHRSFGMNAFGRLWAVLSEWRSDETALLLLLPLSGGATAAKADLPPLRAAAAAATPAPPASPAADAGGAGASGAAAGPSATVDAAALAASNAVALATSRRELILWKLQRAREWLAQQQQQGQTDGASPASDSPAADVAAIAAASSEAFDAVARTFSVREPVPLLPESHWRALALVLVAGLAEGRSAAAAAAAAAAAGASAAEAASAPAPAPGTALALHIASDAAAEIAPLPPQLLPAPPPPPPLPPHAPSLPDLLAYRAAAVVSAPPAAPPPRRAKAAPTTAELEAAASAPTPASDADAPFPPAPDEPLSPEDLALLEALLLWGPEGAGARARPPAAAAAAGAASGGAAAAATRRAEAAAAAGAGGKAPAAAAAASAAAPQRSDAELLRQAQRDLLLAAQSMAGLPGVPKLR